MPKKPLPKKEKLTVRLAKGQVSIAELKAYWRRRWQRGEKEQAEIRALTKLIKKSLQKERARSLAKKERTSN